MYIVHKDRHDIGSWGKKSMNVSLSTQANQHVHIVKAVIMLIDISAYKITFSRFFQGKKKIRKRNKVGRISCLIKRRESR